MKWIKADLKTKDGSETKAKAKTKAGSSTARRKERDAPVGITAVGVECAMLWSQ
jgi:hypothetical protein